MVRRRLLTGLLIVGWACASGSGTSDPAQVPDVWTGDASGIPEPGADPEADAPEEPEEVAEDLPGDTPPDDPYPGGDAVSENGVILWARGPEFPLSTAVSSLAPEAFERMSLFATEVRGPPNQRPTVGHRGSFGAGNGLLFAFIGLVDPLNTLHSLVGPTYERRPDFFGDYAMTLAGPDGDEAFFEAEWAGKSLSAPVILTRAIRRGVTLVTVDLATPEGLGDLPSTCWIRGLWIQAAGGLEGWSLVLRAANSLEEASPGRWRETGNLSDGRVRDLVTGFWGPGEAVSDGDRIRLPLDSGSGEEGAWWLWVACASDRPISDSPPADWPSVPSRSPAELLGDALRLATARYRAWEEGTVQFDLPDPLVADFLDGIKMTLKVQTSATGASCPMSQYTRTWTRDNMGPVMALLAYGAFQDTAAILDYLEGAIRWSGDLRNSYDADLDPATAPPEPDWGALGTLDHRVAAETPSYLVRMHSLHARYTGDTTRIASRIPLLRRCMLDQAFGPGDLLPFTGDETFRAAMNAALGVPDLDFPHHDRSWSLNSTLLWLGAARDLTEWLDVIGETGLAEDLRERAIRMANETVPRYLLPDGCLAAFLDRETGIPSGPFEDAALQITWGGWLDGEEDLAQSSLACLERRIRRAPGEWVSPMDPFWKGALGAWDGVYTGMLPGYTLAAMTAVGHPEAQAAFDAIRLSLDTSGNLQEYLIFDDHSGLSVAYDPTGVLGDYTAKFRPWEGGIVAEAALRFLLGFSPDARRRSITLRPHLPESWPRMAFQGLAAGEARFDVEVGRLDGSGRFQVVIRQVAGMGGAPFSWEVRWDAPAGRPSFRIEGQPVPEDRIERFVSRFGTVSARVPVGEVPRNGHSSTLMILENTP